jgi:transcriptional regulator with XRE-family HTH domain
MDLVLGRGFRALRIRKGLRQEDLGRIAHVSRGMISKIECGLVDAVPVGVLRAVAAALGSNLDVRLRWHGEGLDRLLDEAHARLVDAVVRLLHDAGWVAAVEVSFSIWGERGSIDVLAWHEATKTVLVIEVKSVVPDSQATFHGLDRKARLAPNVARERGWEPQNVARLLVVAESSTSRQRISRLGATYDTALPSRNAEVRRWIRQPDGQLAGLLFLRSASVGSTKRRSSARERVRRSVEPDRHPDSSQMPRMRAYDADSGTRFSRPADSAMPARRNGKIAGGEAPRMATRSRV